MVEWVPVDQGNPGYCLLSSSGRSLANASATRSPQLPARRTRSPRVFPLRPAVVTSRYRVLSSWSRFAAEGRASPCLSSAFTGGHRPRVPAALLCLDYKAIPIQCGLTRRAALPSPHQDRREHRHATTDQNLAGSDEVADSHCATSRLYHWRLKSAAGANDPNRRRSSHFCRRSSA
jgi:hypothetical protein